MPKQNKSKSKNKNKKKPVRATTYPVPSSSSASDELELLPRYYIRAARGSGRSYNLIRGDFSATLLGDDMEEAHEAVTLWLYDQSRVYYYQDVSNSVFNAFLPDQRKGLLCYVAKSAEKVALLLCRKGAMMLVGYGSRVHDSEIYATYAARVEECHEEVLACFDTFDSQQVGETPSFALTEGAFASHEDTTWSKSSTGGGELGLSEYHAQFGAIDTAIKEWSACGGRSDHAWEALHAQCGLISPDYYIDYHTAKQSFVVYFPLGSGKRSCYQLSLSEKELYRYGQFLHGQGVNIWPKMASVMQYFPSFLNLCEVTGSGSLRQFCEAGNLSRLLGVLLVYSESDAKRYNVVSTQVLACVCAWLCEEDQRDLLTQDAKAALLLLRALMRFYPSLASYLSQLPESVSVDAWVDVMRTSLQFKVLYQQAELCVDVHDWLFQKRIDGGSCHDALSCVFYSGLAAYCRVCTRTTVAEFPDAFLALCLGSEMSKSGCLHENARRLLSAQQDSRRRSSHPLQSPSSLPVRDSSLSPQQELGAEDDAPASLDAIDLNRLRAHAGSVKHLKRSKPRSSLVSNQSAQDRLRVALATQGKKEGYVLGENFIDHSSACPGRSFAVQGCQDSRVVAVRRWIDQGDAAFVQLQSNEITTQLQRCNLLIRPMKIFSGTVVFADAFPIIWRYDPQEKAYLGFWQNDIVKQIETLWLQSMSKFFQDKFSASEQAKLHDLAQAIMPMFADRQTLLVDLTCLASDEAWLVQQSAYLLHSLIHLDLQAALLLLQQDGARSCFSQLVKYFDAFGAKQKNVSSVERAYQDYQYFRHFSGAVSTVSSRAMRLEYQSQVVLYVPDTFQDNVSACHGWMHEVTEAYYQISKDQGSSEISFKSGFSGLRDVHLREAFSLSGIGGKIGRRNGEICHYVNCQLASGVGTRETLVEAGKYLSSIFNNIYLWYKVCYVLPKNRKEQVIAPTFMDLQGRASHVALVGTLEKAPVEWFILFNTYSIDHEEMDTEVQLFYANACGETEGLYNNQDLRDFMQQWRAYVNAMSVTYPDAGFLAEILNCCDGNTPWDWTEDLVKQWASILPLAYTVTCAMLQEGELSEQDSSSLRSICRAFGAAKKSYQQTITSFLRSRSMYSQAKKKQQVPACKTTYNSWYLSTMGEHDNLYSPLSQLSLLSQQGGDNSDRYSTWELWSILDMEKAGPVSQGLMEQTLSTEACFLENLFSQTECTQLGPDTNGSQATQVQQLWNTDYFKKNFAHFFQKKVVLKASCYPKREYGKRAVSRAIMLVDEGRLPKQDFLSHFPGLLQEDQDLEQTPRGNCRR